MGSVDNHHRRLAGGICLIVGPALTLAGWTMLPSISDENSEWVPEIAAATTRSAVGIALAAAGVALSIVGYLALMHLLREHRPLAGDVGGALAVVGSALIAGVMGLALAEVEVIRQLGDSEQVATLIDDVDESAAVAVLFAGPLLATIGLVVLAVGLTRAHVTPVLFTTLFGTGAVVQAVGFFALASMPVVITGFALMFLGFGAIGFQLLFETDEDWEHVPIFERYGFHRVSATT